MGKRLTPKEKVLNFINKNLEYHDALREWSSNHQYCEWEDMKDKFLSIDNHEATIEALSYERYELEQINEYLTKQNKKLREELMKYEGNN